MPSFFKPPTLAAIGRRLLLGATALAFVLVVGAVLARVALTGLAVNRLLRLAGASESAFKVTAASPWNVVVEDLAFRVRTQSVAAQRVSFSRAHWWTPSLGSVRVEGLRLPFTIDGSDVNPWAWSHYENGTAQVSPWKIPAEEISLDGQLILKAAALPDQVIAVKLAAKPGAGKIWTGQAAADGPGLGIRAEGTLNPTTNELTFRLAEAAFDLQPWQAFAQRLLPLPGGNWELAGKFQGGAQGRWAGKVFAATATVNLHGGRAANPERGVAAEGIEAELEFTDLDQVVTKPG
ncbi:MAG: Dicarboxylate transport, partial [Lacunisphaera sp.]|nr:Dicarboxylate transport [Lacunisphaera sp.]